MPVEPGLRGALSSARRWSLPLVALAAITCTHGVRTDSSPDTTQVIAEARPGSRASAKARASAAKRAKIARRPTPSRAALREGKLALPRFYAALHELAAGQRSAHVRVAWLGDSHTAADFLTDAVRQPLQRRFGAGGPGLVLLGLRHYRNAQASVQLHGDWRSVPAAPATVQALDAGFFGLAGIGASPLGPDSSLSVTVDPTLPWARAPLSWEFVYRLPLESSEFVVSGAGLPAPELVTSQSSQKRASGLTSIALRTESDPTVFVGSAAAAPELFGVFIETAGPGVVLDTLGINGARIQTPLAWQAQPWVEELRARAPSLVVLSYGTNEVGDLQDVAEYRALYAQMLERVRSGSDADCLILGPTERVLADWTMFPRVLEIEDVQRQAAAELSCGFFSLVDAMGGPGSFRAWAFARPPLARKDRVHLLAAGYRQVGALLAAQLLGSYSALYPEPTVSRASEPAP
jgi:lysophospholipase L1-like esterase